MKEDIPASADGHGNPEKLVFSKRMDHGSMFKLTAEGNKHMAHRVTKEKGWTGVRYSIVLRCIKDVVVDTRKRKRENL